MRQSFMFEQPHLAVVHDQGRVPAGAVADRRLDVDGDGQPAGQLHRLPVPGADEPLEAERPQHLLQLVVG